MAERLGSPGEAELYLPDSLAAPSPDGVVCEGWGSSQREFHAFHLLHFDVEGVRCSGVFLPCRVAPQCWHSFEDKAPSCEGWTLQKVFFFVYISSAPKALELTQLLIYAVTYGKTNTEEVGSNLGA